MEDAFRSFYSTLDPSKFKYFVKGDSFLVYDRDIQLLPPELRSKGTRSVRLDNIEPVVRDLLTQRNISVEEYSEDLSLSRSGSPTNYGGFTDICLNDSLPPTLCAVSLATEEYFRTTLKASAITPAGQDSCHSSSKPFFVEFSVLVDGRIRHTVFADDDLFSRLYSLVSYYNCTEALYVDSVFTRALRQWGLSDTLLSKNSTARTGSSSSRNSLSLQSQSSTFFSATQEMIRNHFKAQFEAENFVFPDCCLIDIRHYDLVDLGCVSSQGRRLLSQWLRVPLLKKDEIEQRLDLSEFFGRAVRLDLSPFTSCDVRRLCARIESRRILVAELARLHDIVMASDELCVAITSACSALEANGVRNNCLSSNSVLHSSLCDDSNRGIRSNFSGGFPEGAPANCSLSSSEPSEASNYLSASDAAGRGTEVPFKASTISHVKSQFLEPLSKIRVALQPLLAEISDRIDISRKRISAINNPAISAFQKERLALLSEAENELASVRRTFPGAKYSDRAFRVPRSAYSQSTFAEKNLVVLSVLKTGVVFLTKNMSRIRNDLDEIEAKIRAEELRILNEIRERARSYVGPLEILNYLIALIDVYTAFGTKTRVPAYSRPVFCESKYSVADFFHPLLEGGECVLNSVCLDLGADREQRASTVSLSSSQSSAVASLDFSCGTNVERKENKLSENVSRHSKEVAQSYEGKELEQGAENEEMSYHSKGCVPKDSGEESSVQKTDQYTRRDTQEVGSFCVITGPNMGGKSTVLKALSMVSLYAQVGCYVPARSAVIPLFDRVFMRIGAQDCSSKGYSTFMIEMMDMNSILRTASKNSLVLVDELGRGTSAADGLALAIAMRDYLLRLQPVTFMATHFSELGRDPRVINMRMGIASDGLLTYRLERGVCDTSFGLEVAERAGFPKEVLENAKKYMASNDWYQNLH